MIMGNSRYPVEGCPEVLLSYHGIVTHFQLIGVVTLQMIIGSNPTAQHLRYCKTHWLYCKPVSVPESLFALIRLQMTCEVTIRITSQLVLVTCMCLIPWNLTKRGGMTGKNVRIIMIMTIWPTAFYISVLACPPIQWMRSFNPWWGTRSI